MTFRSEPVKVVRLCATETAMCMHEDDMHKLKSAHKQAGEVLHDILGKLGRAKFARILHKGREWLADTTTGSLYCPTTLRCMSSDRLSARLI